MGNGARFDRHGIERVARGEPIDLVLTADTGSERPETYAYLPIFQQWIGAGERTVGNVR